MIRCNVRVRQFFAYSVFAYFTYFSLSICSRHPFDRNRFFSGFVFTSKRVPWGTFLRTHSWWRRLDKRQREISPSSSGDSNLQTSKSAVQCSSTRATIVAHHALVLLWFLNPSFLDIHNLKCSKKTNLCSFLSYQQLSLKNDFGGKTGSSSTPEADVSGNCHFRGLRASKFESSAPGPGSSSTTLLLKSLERITITVIHNIFFTFTSWATLFLDVNITLI